MRLERLPSAARWTKRPVCSYQHMAYDGHHLSHVARRKKTKRLGARRLVGSRKATHINSKWADATRWDLCRLPALDTGLLLTLRLFNSRYLNKAGCVSVRGRGVL